MTIAVEVKLAPRRRAVDVVWRADHAGEGPVDLTFPVWTPGSYLVREHERHVHELTALADGRPIGVEKIAKNVYRLDAGRAHTLEVRFEVYAHELTVRTSHVDGSHAFLNPVTLVPFVPGRENEPHELSIRELPPDWGLACALDEVRPNTLAARDYAELVDSPIECGPHARAGERDRFVVGGVTHEIVHWGRSPLDRAKFAGDAARIAEAHLALFGEFPYRRYLALLHASDAGRGGLEHRASAALLFARGSLHKPKGYEELLGLFSHELFHAWNVKAIRPEAFSPYDLTRECHTRQLWAFEGLTSYYEDLALVRSGLVDRPRFLEMLGENLTSLARNPGRLRHPLAEASFDAWIRYYRQDENWNDSSTSYYLKGALVGALVDLEIRRRTNGAKSLDDAMRRLHREAKSGRAVPEGGVEAACEEAAGESMRELFDLALRRTDELPMESALASHGLELARRIAIGVDDKGGSAPHGEPIRCDTGLGVKPEGERLRVASVRRGSPAEAAGLCPGDELVAMDGLKIEPSTFLARLHARAPASEVRFVGFRRDELVETTLVPAEPAENVVEVREAPAATEAEKALGAAWLAATSKP